MSDRDRTTEALSYCRDVTRRRARNFYYGLKLTPEPQRSALYTIYAWMRRADDLVDAAGSDDDDRRAKIDAFRAATDAAVEGTVPNTDPLWIALAHTAANFEIGRDALGDMLDGQIQDLSGQRYATFDDMRDYCYRVASTVGLICIRIWGYSDPAAPELAVNRGIAFQLTNILRDYKEDYDSGRVYLPQEDFDRHDLTPERVRRWDDAPACRRFIRDQVQRARSFYVSSGPLDRMITPSCRPTLWAMTRIYYGLLRKIERRPRRIVRDHRLRLSSLRKGSIAVLAPWLAGREPAVGEA